jgi:4'-phosphopantetheinyl transferase EntD
MIEKILPAQVASAEAFDDAAHVALFPEEEAALARSVATRRREFATARLCARRALAALGRAPAPVPPGRRGAPQWPPGVVGSITHCTGFRAAAVAHATDMVTIGIDAEPDDALPDGVLDAISTAEERAWLREVAGTTPGACWDRLLFSAKESVYKAWFPLAGRQLGFEDAVVTVDPVGGTFSARVLVPGPVVAGQRLRGLAGRWLARDGLLLTAIAIPRRQLTAQSSTAIHTEPTAPRTIPPKRSTS